MYDDRGSTDIKGKPTQETSDMHVEDMLQELSNLDDGIRELSHRRTILTRELRSRRDSIGEFLDKSESIYNQITGRDEEAVPMPTRHKEY